jgi:hypothetical protein
MLLSTLVSSTRAQLTASGRQTPSWLKRGSSCTHLAKGFLATRIHAL